VTPSPGPREVMRLNTYQLITDEWRRQGVEIVEDGDHVIELRKDGQVIARFSQTGVTLEELQAVLEEHQQN